MAERGRSLRLPFAATTPTSHLLVALLVWWHVCFLAVQALAALDAVAGGAETVAVLAINALAAVLAAWLLRIDAASGVSIPRFTYPLLVVAPPVGVLRYLLRVGEDR